MELQKTITAQERVLPETNDPADHHTSFDPSFPFFENKAVRDKIIEQLDDSVFYPDQGEVVSSVRIYEESDSYMIELSIPGSRIDDCTVRGNILYVSGKRYVKRKMKGRNLGNYGTAFLNCSYRVSDHVNTDDIEAICLDGMLMLRVFKKRPYSASGEWTMPWKAF